MTWPKHIIPKRFAYLVYRESWVVRCSKWLLLSEWICELIQMLHSFGGNSYLLKLGAGQGQWYSLQVEETSAKGGRSDRLQKACRKTIIEDWRLAVATSGRQLQLQPAGAITERAGKCISNRFNLKKIIWGELAMFEFGGPRIKISCIKFVEDGHPDAQCMAYLNYPNVGK